MALCDGCECEGSKTEKGGEKKGNVFFEKRDQRICEKGKKWWRVAMLKFRQVGGEVIISTVNVAAQQDFGDAKIPSVLFTESSTATFALYCSYHVMSASVSHVSAFSLTDASRCRFLFSPFELVSGHRACCVLLQKR
jgi:hypothetical protein